MDVKNDCLAALREGWNGYGTGCYSHLDVLVRLTEQVRFNRTL